MTVTNYNWQLEGGDTANVLLGAINTLHGKPMFAPQSSAVRTVSLPFYNNVSLVRATAKATIPPMRMNYLYDGEDVVHLDFSAEPIESVNRRALAALTNETLPQYLAFYFSSVRGDEGPMQLVESFADIEVTGEMADETKERITAFVGPMQIEPVDEGGFLVKTHLVYAQNLYRVELSVSEMGAVDVTSEHILFTDLPTRPLPVK